MKRLIAALVLLIASSASGHAQPKTELSTKVMDAVAGKSAIGMTVELYEVSGDTLHKVAQAVTNSDGRAFLFDHGPIPVGTYELRFLTADYFKRSVAAADTAVLEPVIVRFLVDDPSGHYHVPIICAPSSYTTYRGS
jgi:hydroxyisourate hydrolase